MVFKKKCKKFYLQKTCDTIYLEYFFKKKYKKFGIEKKKIIYKYI